MRNVEYRHEHWCCSRQCCEEDIRYALGLQRRVQQLYAAGKKSARDLEDAVEEVAAAIERHDECQEMRDDLFAADGMRWKWWWWWVLETAVVLMEFLVQGIMLMWHC